MRSRVIQRFNLDERVVESTAKAVTAQEFARLHNVVREEITRVSSEVEEELNKRSVDVEVISRLIDEEFNRVINELDKRFMHVLSVIDEQFGEVRDVLNLTSEILRIEIEIEEELGRLRDEVRKHLNEEYLEELLYRALVRHRVLKRKRRKWAPNNSWVGYLGGDNHWLHHNLHSYISHTVHHHRHPTEVVAMAELRLREDQKDVVEKLVNTLKDSPGGWAPSFHRLRRDSYSLCNV